LELLPGLVDEAGYLVFHCEMGSRGGKMGWRLEEEEEAIVDLVGVIWED
jgi:hypothetical protein